jgi:hypothetical protein
MEVAQVQASQLSDDERNPGMSQIVNLSENEESDSGSSDSSKDRSMYNFKQYKIFLSVTYF